MSTNASAEMGANPGGSQDAGFFRASLQQGMVPTEDSVSVEGFLSEHTIASPAGECEEVLCLSGAIVHDTSVSENDKATLIHLGMGSNIDLATRPRVPLNLAVVVDVSGSMQEAGKLEYVKAGLLLMLEELQPTDRLAIITYSTEAQILVPSQLMEEKESFEFAVRGLMPNGSTNLHGGMMLGYQELEKHVSGDVLSRLMLLSDGLANRGEIDPEMIVSDSKHYNDQGIGISTIGVGMDFNQDLMRSLSEQGGGNFYFIEDPAKASTVFQQELDFLLTPIANNLKITLNLADGFSHIDTFGLPRSWNGSNQLVVEVPTVFASRKSGAMLIRVQYEAEIESFRNGAVLDMAYSYQPIAEDGTVQDSVQLINEVTMPTQNQENYRLYDTEGSLKAMVLWNMVSTFKAASREYHNGSHHRALELIESLAAYVDDANQLLEDKELSQDRNQLINLYAINLGGWVGEPYGEYGCYEEDSNGCYYGEHGYYGDDYYLYGCSSTGSDFPAWGTLGLMLMVASRLRRRRGQEV